MKFQYASDIHLEILEQDSNTSNFTDEDFRFLIEPECPVLILAGDILTPNTKNTSRFLQWCSKNFDHTFWVLGNHEYYTPVPIPMSFIVQKYRSMCPPNVHLLNNETYLLDDILFVGTTLWSSIPKEDEPEIRNSINDYRMIYNENGYRLTPREVNQMYETNLAFLNKTIRDHEDNQIIVITHHAPLNQGTSYKEYEQTVRNKAFASNITLINDTNVKYWICGHTHHNFQIQKNGYTVMSNQLGYLGEHTGLNYDFSPVTEVI